MNGHFAYLKKRDPIQGQYRFYTLHLTQSLFGDWTLVREWGRIGSPGRMMMDWFDNFEDAPAALQHKVSEKLRKGYQDISSRASLPGDNVTR